ncbi:MULTISPECIES: hypothetical protein [Microtetraspora]|uniref:DUF948 domain-containing protein n=1 Tax=Microtetraspora glauca TaxID=1996 RepID=A0ABV3GGE9_MICGL|nr:hypothetical protein [Microtetraspora sp. AC03309]MCC5581913.1 hypothetical protein [Microtetraspora sp. AC03309]
MIWISASVALAVIGLAVLGVLASRVLVAARGLSREIDRTRQRLERHSGDFRVGIGTNQDGHG